MGYAIYDVNHGRWGGYGVPAYCDAPGCKAKIDRGMSHVCSEPRGDEHGCGLYFCGKHLWYRQPKGHYATVQNCQRCKTYKPAYSPKPEHPHWVRHLLRHSSWKQWRQENPAEVKELSRQLLAYTNLKPSRKRNYGKRSL